MLTVGRVYEGHLGGSRGRGRGGRRTGTAWERAPLERAPLGHPSVRCLGSLEAACTVPSFEGKGAQGLGGRQTAEGTESRTRLPRGERAPAQRLHLPGPSLESHSVILPAVGLAGLAVTRRVQPPCRWAGWVLTRPQKRHPYSPGWGGPAGFLPPKSCCSALLFRELTLPSVVASQVARSLEDVQESGASVWHSPPALGSKSTLRGNHSLVRLPLLQASTEIEAFSLPMRGFESVS